MPVADPPAPLAGLIGETDRRLGPTTADHLYVVVPEGHRLARREAVSVTDLEAEPLILPRRATPAGRFRSVVEQLCAQAGFVPRVAYELDDLPAVQSFVAAGIAVVLMHGLTLANIPPGATTRPLAERSAGQPYGRGALAGCTARAGGRPARPPGRRGASFDERQANTYRVRDGRVTEIREYREMSEALEVLGLSEQDAHADS